MHKSLISERVGKIWGIVAIGVTLVMIFGFVVGQQVFRMSANDPQAEIIDGVADALAAGQDPKALGTLAQVDLQKNLTPFIVAFDRDRKLLAGNGQVDGQTPVPPDKAFSKANQKGKVQFTWSPKQGVKIASIMRYYASGEISGFVLVGKSLREVEARTKTLLKLSVIAWIGAMAISFTAVNLLFGKREEHVHSPGEHPHSHHTS